MTSGQVSRLLYFFPTTTETVAMRNRFKSEVIVITHNKDH